MVSEEREERRTVALAAARELLISDGVGGLSMRRLARSSGMAVNTLYALFGTRDGILEALVDETIRDRVAAMQAATGDDADPIRRLRTMVGASVKHAILHSDNVKPMYRAAGELRDLRNRATGMGLGLFSERFRACLDAGRLRDDVEPGQLAEQLMVLVNHASLAWALGEIGDEELAARCDLALATVVASAVTPNELDDIRAWLSEASRSLASITGWSDSRIRPRTA